VAAPLVSAAEAPIPAPAPAAVAPAPAPAPSAPAADGVLNGVSLGGGTNDAPGLAAWNLANLSYCKNSFIRRSMIIVNAAPSTPPLPLTSPCSPGPVSVVYGINGATARMCACADASHTAVRSSRTTL